MTNNYQDDNVNNISEPGNYSVPGMSQPRIGPSSPEAEEAVLGAILINPESLYEVSAFLQATDFYILKNQWVWESILAVHERGDAIDNITLVEELRSQGRLENIGGSSYITYLINNTPSHIHAETYAHIIERAAVRRRLLDAAQTIAKTAIEENVELEDIVNRSETTLFSVTQRQIKKEMVSIRLAAHEYFDQLLYLYENRDQPRGVPSGFTDLDRLLGGLQKSDLIIVAARPGVGKTSFMLSIALNAARMGNARIGVFSLEMSREQLVQRLFSAETGIQSQKLRSGDLDENEWSRFVEATSRLDKLSIFIDDTPGATINQMRAKCRRLYREEGLDLVVIDYLQLMESGTRTDNRVQEISYISRGLKELARELNVPVLTAAQLSRAVEQRSDKRPMLSDLRESGCLTGDTLIWLPDSGRYVPIRELNGKSNFKVASLMPNTYKIDMGHVSNAFCTGIKPVFRLTTQLGRTIRATANHKFLTINGWKRLDELTVDDHVAVPRLLVNSVAQTMPKVELSLSEYSVGNKPAPLRHAVQYMPNEEFLAQRDVYWDAIQSVEPDGDSDVYDLTVPGYSNFVANDIIVHNSIEQDADIVMFLYREELYDENTEKVNQADVLVSKHRNGPTGTITLYFKRELTQFMNMSKSNVNLAQL